MQLWDILNVSWLHETLHFALTEQRFDDIFVLFTSPNDLLTFQANKISVLLFLINIV